MTRTCLLRALWIVVLPIGLLAQAPVRPAVRTPTTPPVWHPVLEAFTPAGVVETEFGSPLSAAGYEKLRAAIHWTASSQRADYYFDAYDGGQFLLRTGGMPLKVRIKRKGRKFVWQVSRFVAKDEVRVGALSVKVHTTESWEAPLKASTVRALVGASDEFASELATGGAPLRATADRVDAAWQTLRAAVSPPGVMVIDRLVAGHAYRFYPRKVTTGKRRLIAPLPGVTQPAVTLLLGSEPEVDANGEVVMTYELEAEPDGAVTAAQSHAVALAIGRLMRKAGLNARDQMAAESFSNDYTLHQLAR